MKTTVPLLITFEGLDGCGKSLQSERLQQKFRAEDIDSILLHEPGSTPLGEEISRLLKWSGTIKPDPVAELFLFNASRAQLVKDVILPALDNRKTVIVDRFTDSTLAYQGYGRGLDIDMLKQINAIATQDCWPDLAILLDIPPREAAARRKVTEDRFESEAEAFHEKVRRGYLELAEEEPERWLVIDGTLNADLVAEIIWESINVKLLQKEA